MKIEWNEEYADIGIYDCALTKDDGRVLEIGVRDYTCPYEQEQYKKDPIRFKHYHPFDYEVHGCWGWSMREGFNKPMTLEEVKIWAEDYLLNMIINTYKDTLEHLEEQKKNAEQAQAIKNARNKKED